MTTLERVNMRHLYTAVLHEINNALCEDAAELEISKANTVRNAAFALGDLVGTINRDNAETLARLSPSDRKAAAVFETELIEFHRSYRREVYEDGQDRASYLARFLAAVPTLTRSFVTFPLMLQSVQPVRSDACVSSTHRKPARQRGQVKDSR